MSKLSSATEENTVFNEITHGSVSRHWPWSHTIVAGDITNDAKDFLIEAEQSDYPAIAEALNVLSVHDLKATLRIHRTKSSLRVRGDVHAIIEQSCVVSLEPVRQILQEEIDRTFVANGADIEAVYAKMNTNREMMIDPDEVDPPEVIENGRLDLAAIALEHVVVGIDLYPRMPDADLSGVSVGNQLEAEEDEPESPFAALAKLKTTGAG